MTEDGAPRSDCAISAKYRIVAGAALVAVLAGGIIGVLDGPGWTGGESRVARNHRIGFSPQAPVAARSAEPTATGAAVPSMAPAVTRSPVEAKPKLRRTKRAARPKSTTASTTRTATAPTSIARDAPTIDAQYEATTALQCAQGITGFFCREKIRWRLCKGRWSDGVQPGASRCRVEKRETAGVLGG